MAATGRRVDYVRGKRATYLPTASAVDVVRGEERLDRQLACGDLDGGAERGDGADERQLARVAVQAQGHGDLGPAVALVIGPGVRRHLLEQRRQRRVAGERDLALEALQQVGAPLAQVGDPGATPSGCRLTRSTFTGGSSSSGATPAVSSATARLAASISHAPSTTTAG